MYLVWFLVSKVALVLALGLLQLAAKGKDETYGKYCVPRSRLDFLDKLHSSLCKLTLYCILAAVKSSSFKTPWKVGL